MQGYIFSINTVSFEGPLDLLLTLIEKKKLHVNDISLANIALEYQEYCQQLETTDPYEVSNFLRVLSSLLLIKSKALLPSLEFTKEEETDMANLKERLKLYEYVRKLSSLTYELMQNESSYRTLNGLHRKTSIFSPPIRLTVDSIELSLSDFFHERRDEILPAAKVTKTISLKEVIHSVHSIVKRSLRSRFFDMIQHITNSKEKVVYFLAVLELSKQGLVDLKQDNFFGDIEIELQSLHVPHYGEN